MLDKMQNEQNEVPYSTEEILHRKMMVIDAILSIMDKNIWEDNDKTKFFVGNLYVKYSQKLQYYDEIIEIYELIIDNTKDNDIIEQCRKHIDFFKFSKIPDKIPAMSE